MLMKTAWSITLLQIRVAVLSPKAWVALFLALLIGGTTGWDCLVVARQLGYPLQMIEPFLILMTSRVMQVFVVVGAALLLSDAPFANMNTPYLVFRTSRRVWMVGNAVYMLIACCLYLLVVMVSSALVAMSFTYIQNQWSPLIQLLTTNQRSFQLHSGYYIGSIVIQRMNPYQACIWQFALLMLYSFCISGVMLLMNTLPKCCAGFAIAMLFHGLMLVMYLDGHPIGMKISLFTHAGLGAHFGNAIPLSTSVLVFSAFSVCVYGISILSARRIDI